MKMFILMRREEVKRFVARIVTGSIDAMTRAGSLLLMETAMAYITADNRAEAGECFVLMVRASRGNSRV